VSSPIPLLCLPFAGMGASYYLPWRSVAPAGLDVVPLELSGHGKRFTEALATSVPAAADDLLGQAQPHLSEHTPVVVFGHSLGAVLAYELVRRLEQRATARVAHLFVSGSPGPWMRRARRAADLDDEEFLRRIEEFAGSRHEGFDDPEILELLLPVLRADVVMHEDYQAGMGPRLRTPVTALRGTEDTLVPAQHAAQWADATAGEFELVEIAGGHLYLSDAAETVLKLIADTVWQGSGWAAR
jgi:surfactin synthase thioesterase subunit